MGHTITYMYPVPSGWRATCSCGASVRGITRSHLLDVHERHANKESP